MWRKTIRIGLVSLIILSITFLTLSLPTKATSGNLLINPGAEDGPTSSPFTGWTTDFNGGDGIKTNFDNVVRTGNRSFQTSFELGALSQRVDLLAEGYTENELDIIKPQINVGVFVASRDDKAAKYYASYKLGAGNGDDILDSHNVGESDDLISLPIDTDWAEISHNFTEYPEGVRYVDITFGGTDDQTPPWLEQYGAHFDDAYVTLEDIADFDDFNGNGNPDFDEPNLSAYTSMITGKTVVIEVGTANDCELNVDDLETEAGMDKNDNQFDYPHGLFDFEAECLTPGDTYTVRLYYYDIDSTELILRKFNPNTNKYIDIEHAVISEEEINGSNVTIVEYAITDGGSLDMDGEVNGLIVDPVGLAKEVNSQAFPELSGFSGK